MSLLLRSNSILTNPDPSVPVIPDLTAGLQWTLDASTLGLANGADVSTWVASGVAAEINRTYRSATAANSNAPKYSTTGGPGGKPCVTFDGYSGFITDVLPAFATPVSFLMTVRIDQSNRPSFTQDRILTFGATGGVFRTDSQNGRIRAVASGATIASSEVLTYGEWYQAIVVFNGAQSRLKVCGLWRWLGRGSGSWPICRRVHLGQRNCAASHRIRRVVRRG